MKPVITVAVLMALLVSHLGYAQNDTPMEVLVNIAHENARFVPTQVFKLDERPTNYLDHYLTAVIPLKLDRIALHKLVEEGPEAISMSLPFHNGQVLSLKLVNHDVRSSDFEIIDLKTNSSLPIPAAQFYRGVVDRKVDAVAGVSFFNDEVYAVFSSKHMGNVVLMPDPVVGGDAENYILYVQENVIDAVDVKCDADVHNKIGEYAPGVFRSNVYNTCEDIEIYIESTYKLYQQKGSTQATTNYISAFFNNAAVLFRNEGIYTSLKKLGINTSEDGYSDLTSSFSNLNKFGDITRNKHKQYGAELAHLVDYDEDGLGGVAWINSTCVNYTYYSSVDYHYGAYAYSNVLTNTSHLQDFPMSVFVFTHEMGHQLGSQHTQWCLWEGGPIDNCASVENGPCAEGPTPSDGGTIMSYCHQNSEIGINLSLGFGEQPGNLIRTRIAEKTCQAEYIPKSTVPAEESLNITANRECTDEDGWTNYYFDNNTSNEGDDMLILSVLKDGENIGNLDDGTLVVQLNTSSNAGSGSTHITNSGYDASEDWYVMNRWFELLPTQEPTNPVTVRFPYTSLDLVDVMVNQPEVTHTDLIFYKVDSPKNPNPDFGHEDVGNDDIHFYMNGEMASLDTWKYVKEGNKHFAEFQVNSFSGGGGGFSENAQASLPVNLESFQAVKVEDKVSLEWKTSLEINNDYFTLERSTDGVIFQKIGTVDGAGTTSEELFYSFKDRKPESGLNYYRLSQTDLDGTLVYLGLRTVNFRNEGDIKVFPNPLYTSTLSLSYDSSGKEDLRINVTSIDGKIIHTSRFKVSSGKNHLDFALPEMDAGIYLVQLIGDVKLYTTKLIKD